MSETKKTALTSHTFEESTFIDIILTNSENVM